MAPIWRGLSGPQLNFSFSQSGGDHRGILGDNGDGRAEDVRSIVVPTGELVSVVGSIVRIGTVETTEKELQDDGRGGGASRSFLRSGNSEKHSGRT